MLVSKVKSLLSNLVGTANFIAFPKILMNMCNKDADITIFLSQLMYWHDRSKDGWVYKTYEDFDDEICLSQRKVRKSKKYLEEKGWIEIDFKRTINGTPKVHYRVTDKLINDMADYLRECTIEKDESNSDLDILPNTTLTKRPPTTGQNVHLQLDETSTSLYTEITNRDYLHRKDPKHTEYDEIQRSKVVATQRSDDNANCMEQGEENPENSDHEAVTDDITASGNVSVALSNAPRYRDIELELDLEKELEKDLEKETPKERATKVPYDEIVEIFHRKCPSLRAVQKITDFRKKLLNARWKEHPSSDFWEEYFETVSKSQFLMGKVNDFQANFEWLIRPNNFIKVLEGNYNGKEINKGLKMLVDELEW
jgi:hypothetical protein